VEEENSKIQKRQIFGFSGFSLSKMWKDSEHHARHVVQRRKKRSTIPFKRGVAGEEELKFQPFYIVSSNEMRRKKRWM